MRPRQLYFAVFTWLVLSGGRFTAPFLTNVAQLSETLTGLALAMQTVCMSMFLSVGGAIADHLEKKYPHRGRAATLIFGLGLSTTAFMLHGVVVHFSQQNSASKFVLSCHVILRMVYSTGLAFVMPVLDGLTLSYLVEQGSQKEDFGKERLFGAVSWAIASVILGPFIDIYGFEVLLVSAPLAFLYCFVTVAVFTHEMTSNENPIGNADAGSDSEREGAIQPDKRNEVVLDNDGPDIELLQRVPDKPKRHFTWLLLKIVCGTAYSVGYILSSFTLSMGTSVVESLIFLFFESLGSSSTMCGLTVVVTVVFEIPIFQMSPKLLELFGPEKLQEIACLAYITRVVGYTFIPKNRMWMVLFLEPLHGVTYACAKTSQVEFAARIAPKGYESSGQGLLQGLIGIGSFIGLSLGGWLEDTFGPKMMYRSYATVVLVGLISLYVSEKLHKKRLEYEKEENNTLVLLTQSQRLNYQSTSERGER
uniref:Major facilitator superfamily associated domain-containing protein n=1 Tax=Helicotheca tamesis TaxID=374047 RepID=A0A7S2N1P0_9STRA|mmetsp:Transcript_7668/g.10457  ORF Transcript_7668/g.10457 Transcript_7668/m.10457 type:complete len:477 (+) Transcript_7668:148-1578(+)